GRRDSLATSPAQPWAVGVSLGRLGSCRSSMGVIALCRSLRSYRTLAARPESLRQHSFWGHVVRRGNLHAPGLRTARVDAFPSLSIVGSAVDRRTLVRPTEPGTGGCCVYSHHDLYHRDTAPDHVAMVAPRF